MADVGVEITQQIAETTSVVAAPTLVPVVMGVCRQIVDATTSDGSLNSDALYSAEQYNQASLLIPQADFPDPRSNIAEIDIEEGEVGLSIYFGGVLAALSRGSNGTYGSSFLKLTNLSTQAAFFCSVPDSFSFDAVTGDVFTLALDVVNPVDTSRDVTVTLLGVLTVQQVVDAMNAAAGATIAEVYTDTADAFGNGPSAQYVLVKSPTYGALSSITIRPGTSALPILFGASFTDSSEYRVEGSGFRGQDDEDGDLTTPWVEFYQGDYLVDGVSATYPALGTANALWAVQFDLDGGFVAAQSGAVTFTGTSATVPLRAGTRDLPGDQFWADGVQAGDGEIVRVEQGRFRIGKLNAELSTFSEATGLATNRVYDDQEVATLNSGVPFAPKYSYFVADGLIFGDVTPVGTEASLSGSGTGISELVATVQSTADITFPLSIASLTLIFQVTEDDVQGAEVTYTFAGGPFATIGDLTTAMNNDAEFDQLSVSNSGDRLIISTVKAGSDQEISIKSVGTANAALNFSTTAATTSIGQDTEYATQASVTSDPLTLPISQVSALPFDLTIVDSYGTHTLSSNIDVSSISTLPLLMQAIAEAFGDPDGSVSPTIYDGGIAIATLTSSDTGSSGTITITTIQGGSDITLELTAVDSTDGFRFVGFYDSTNGQPAVLTAAAPQAGAYAGIDSQTITLDYNSGTSISGSVTGIDGQTTAAAAAAVLNADTTLNGSVAGGGTRLLHWFADASGTLGVRTVEGGSAVTLEITSGATATALGITTTSATGVAAVENSDDTGANLLAGSRLVFRLDDNPHDYDIIFATNSLSDAVDDINNLVNGAGDVASESAGQITLTSLFAGAASAIEVDADLSTADTILGLSGSAEGTGRPNPDFYLDGSGSLNVGANILRNRSSGIPFALSSALGDMYISYKALRLDVTPSAENAAMLEFSDVATMVAAIGPISTENPLALGTFLCLTAAPTNAVSAIGIDEFTDAAPEGTLDGWARTLDFLGSREVYAMAPLTEDAIVQQLLATHVTSLSQPEERGERVALIWGSVPDRAVDTTIASGEEGQTTGSDNSFTLDTNPASNLIANGIDPTDTVPVSDQLYLELLLTLNGSTELRRYSVSFVNGVVLSLRTTFATGENDDGFFSTTVLTEALSDADWSLKIRGEELFVTGTTIPDLASRATAAAAQATPYANRRVVYMICDSADTSIDGVTQNVPGYYVAASVAGMVAELAPQQPFTNLNIPGFSRVYGTDDTFSDRQLETISQGGRWVIQNQGTEAITTRHQRTTSTTSIETREFSITKAIDWLAKGLRSTNRVFLGRSVITSGFLDQLTLSNEGFLRFAVQLGVVQRAQLTSLLQDADNRDTVLVEVEVQPSYPCNKIKITIIS